jgi:hypothetical protein
MQFNQTNKNLGDVNNAISGKGSVTQSVGDRNKVQVEQPKENFWASIVKKISTGWKWLAG